MRDLCCPPREGYARALQKPGFTADPSQARAVEALQHVHDELLARPSRKYFGRRRWPAVPGVYLWGGVGRGKTWLMDLFYESLPFSGKRRTHFHRFMWEIHDRLRRHGNTQDPLARVAGDIAGRTRVLCFDEFFVSDIADAMILGRLTENLFQRGVTLMTTANLPPDDLYRGGLQRERFLPAIEYLKRHCTVLHVDGATDYRLRTLSQAEIYHHPCDAAAESNLARWFARMAPDGAEPAELELHGRTLPARRLAQGVAWFDFPDLCETARAAADYIEIARTHHTVLIGRVPGLTVDDEEAARRFVNLVDEFYDRGVKLILAAHVPRERLYTGRRLKFEFERTHSRLVEMQSQAYLARPHLP
ncbi:MAG: AFG1 family ATPase [Nevskiales bacterium]|nr:AFG1 family ATPase [Nevskiales bacterium]